MPPPRGFLNETLPGERPPSWMEAASPPPPDRPSLTTDLSVDVAVTGAGLAGLSAALTLAEQGVRVAVIDAHRVGWGASGRGAGRLDTLPLRETAFFERAVGLDDAKTIVGLAADAAALARRRVRDHRIDCALTDGLITAHHRPDRDAPAEAETARLRDVYGIDSLEYLPPERLTDWVRARGQSGGVRNRAGGALQPLALARGLASAAEAAGALVFERSRLVDLDPGRVSWADPNGVHQAMRATLTVETATGRATLSADRAILCLGGLHDGLAPDYARRVAPLRVFHLATEPLGERLSGLLPGGAAVSDTRPIAHAYRPTPDGRLLFSGGATARARGPRDIARVVRARLARVFPELASVRIDHAWSETRGMSAHRAPVFRQPAKRLIAVGGWSGADAQWAMLGGAIAAEAALGRLDRFAPLARVPAPPFPFTGRAAGSILATALLWRGLRDRLGA